jgi:hypothetical protein
MNERPKTRLEQANEMLLKDHPAERLKKIEGEAPSVVGLITTEIDLARRTERKQ